MVIALSRPVASGQPFCRPATYQVRVSDLQVRPKKEGDAYVARWTVARQSKSLSFATAQLAASFLSDLRQAAKAGEEFDLETGLPFSMTPGVAGPTLLKFSQAYMMSRWGSIAARTRETDAYAFMEMIPAFTADQPGRPPIEQLRKVLRESVLLPPQRRRELTAPMAEALAWLEKASLPVAMMAEADQLRGLLVALGFNRSGEPAAANTVRRRRAILHHLLECAVEEKIFEVNPLSQIKWRLPQTVREVDPRVVATPSQARGLLNAVARVGRDRGQRMQALFACMYYAALRPEEVADLRLTNCDLPEDGWGMITLERARPQASKNWSNSGLTHEPRSLKHRADGATRDIPIPPNLVLMLSEHVLRYGLAADGRIFFTPPGGSYSSSAYSHVWQEARKLALTPAQVTSSLAARPYDLRHAAVTLWLNSGVPAPEVARRAGHSVDVLLRVYARCMDDDQRHNNARIELGLRG